MDQYAERNGYTSNVLLYEDFMSYVRALDEEYLNVVSEEMARKQKQAESEGKSQASAPKRSKW